MAAALLPSLSSPRSVPGGDQNTFSHFQHPNLAHAHNRGPRLTHRDYDEWIIFIFFMSLLYATVLRAVHIPALSKLPQFCLKVMFIAWLWLGLVTHNLQFHVKINFNPSSRTARLLYFPAQNIAAGADRLLELETKVHPKVRNHGDGSFHI